MTQLLQPAKLDPQFEYEVKKNKDVYVAGAINCFLHNGVSIWGDLFLDKLGEKDTKIWKPKLINPFATEIKKESIRDSELYVPESPIAYSCWKGHENYSLEEFITALGEGILQRYQARMSRHDLKQFFEKVHRRYMDFF